LTTNITHKISDKSQGTHATTPRVDQTPYRRALKEAGVTVDDMKLLRELADTNERVLSQPSGAPLPTRTFL
jgi:hypothetical protein